MPVDRMRMRPWLEQQIESGLIQGLHWVNKEKKIFQIPWMHAARHGWDLEKDAPLFKNWAIHTGKYCPGIDKPDPKTWKANFRCAMNSLTDIEEVKDKSMKRGNNAFRMYRILSVSEKAVKKGRKKMDLEQRVIRVFQKRKANTPRKLKMMKQSGQEEINKETLPDSTVLFAEQENVPKSKSLERKEAVGELPEVCAVVEVATESNEPAVSSSKVSYPIQDSHVSYHSESDSESTYSDEDLVQLPQDLSLNASQRSSCGSVLRIPPSAQSSFITSGKTNLRVTSCREDSPLIAYNTAPWFPLLLGFQNVTDVQLSTPAPTPELTSSPTSRANIIAKAMDLSVSSRKAL
ncbi:interferon regulatory factor 2-like isoform X1 [Myxocyprinus asiaticus]|uniref:interferon regulatory factor 2-like isoform X1 n=1 Tax=Myxocyprinus asiaticus TaxID=70543 RepID=UPI00222309E7|nr:interferon regulatory factor 2-like isoform X1 [Myxocyprinus asiaticus]